jgi:AcrR family transcriptional regulator
MDLRGGIVDAASSVFSRIGFAVARVEDILSEADVARRTFYKYFSGKEDVLLAIYQLATDELIAAIQLAGAKSEGDPLDAIRRGLDAYLDYHVAHAGLLRVLVQEAVRSESPLAVHRRRFREALARLLDAAVRSKSGEEHDPLFYAALISAVEGVSLDLLSEKPSVRQVRRAKESLHLLLSRALDVPPAPARPARGRRR